MMKNSPFKCVILFCREKRLALKSELQIRKKAMQIDDFPSQEIIDEFMQEPNDMSSVQLNWCQPNVVKFVVKKNVEHFMS